MKIYIHRGEDWYDLYLNDNSIRRLEEFAEVVTEGNRMEPLSEDELISRLEGVDVLLSLNGKGVADFTPRVIKAMSKSVKLVCIAQWWKIHNTFAPMCRENGIEVVEGSNMCTVAVAEWTLGCMLMGRRNILEFNNRMKTGVSWGEPRRDCGLVRGATVSLVGLGRIGRYVAHWLKMFGCKVIAYDAIPDEEIRKLGIEPVSLMDCFSKADIVSLHLPVNESTEGMIKAEHFAAIRDGAVFVNSARAALYKDEELLNELKKDRFYAFLDVFAEPEPLPLDSEFRKLGYKTTINPHIAGDNKVMFRQCGDDSIESLRYYAETGVFENRQLDYNAVMTIKA